MDTLNLTALPESFPAGTTVSYVKSFSGFSNGTWTLKLYLAGAKTLAVDGVVSGTGWRLTLAALDTEGLQAGVYSWVERLDTGGGNPQRIDMANGFILVTPDLAAAADGDQQPWAEKMIPILEAAIEGRLPSGMESYQIAGRAVSKIPIPELFKLLTMLRNQVAKVEQPNRISKPVLMSFPNPGGRP